MRFAFDDDQFLTTWIESCLPAVLDHIMVSKVMSCMPIQKGGIGRVVSVDDL